MRALGVHHVSLNVDDVPAAVEFYVETLRDHVLAHGAHALVEGPEPGDVVDGHRVTLTKEPAQPGKKLYFVNLGAYADGEFTELHANAIVVASSCTAASSSRSRRAARYSRS